MQNELVAIARPGADVIVRERERKAITAVCRTAWWAREREGTVPARVSLGKRAVGWRMSELQAWIRGEWTPNSRGCRSLNQADAR